MAKADDQSWQTVSWPDTRQRDVPSRFPARFGFKTERAYTFLALARARRAALHIRDFDLSRDRYIIFSDTHKGDRSRGADEFQINDELYCHALEYYLNCDYRLVLNGDIEEGWKASYDAIIAAYESTAFQWEREFARRGPGHYLRIWGNHDMDWRNPGLVKRYLQPVLRQPVRVHPAVLLGDRIMIAHGHQGDFNSDRLAWLSRRVVRYLWKPIQRVLGVVPSRNPHINRLTRLRDRHLAAWTHAQRLLLIAGHTHAPLMDLLNGNHQHATGDSAPPAHYINGGCCVDNHSITGVEIDQGEIRLVKWESAGELAPIRRTVFQRADLGASLAQL